MKISKIIHIIKEELEDFWSDWQSEPSMADKYYEKLTGTAAQIQKSPDEPQITGERVGFVTTQWGKPIEKPIPLYKNPTTLNGFENFARGVLLADGNIYLATSGNALHDDILKVLGELGVVPYGKTYNYATAMPEEFVAVQRVGNTTKFAQSSAYDEFPEYYQEIFNNGNKTHSYKFIPFNY
jgi:hypothetical protein